MQTYLAEGTKADKSAAIGFKDANVTIITPLIEVLNNDENVKLVRFIETHPELDDRKLFVEVKEGSALDAVMKALDGVSDYYSATKE